MKLRIAAVLFLVLAAFASPASAQSLEQAKAQGLVGETAHGYLDVIKGGGDMQRLVDSINLQRKQNYRDIARKNGTSLEAIEAIAGEKLISRAAKGEFVKGADGKWTRK